MALSRGVQSAPLRGVAWGWDPGPAHSVRGTGLIPNQHEVLVTFPPKGGKYLRRQARF